MVCQWYSVCPLRRLESENKINDQWKKKYCLSENYWRHCRRYQSAAIGQSDSDLMLPDGSFVNENK